MHASVSYIEVRENPFHVVQTNMSEAVCGVVQVQVTGSTGWIGAVKATILGWGWPPGPRTSLRGMSTNPSWFRSFSHRLNSLISAGT